MAPVVDFLESRLHQGPSPEKCFATGTEHAECFRFRDLLCHPAGSNQDIGKIVAQLDSGELALIHPDTIAVKSLAISHAARRFHFLGALQLDVDQQISLPGQPDSSFTVPVSQHDTNAPG